MFVHETLIGEKVNELVDGIDWAAAGSRVGYYVNALFSTAYWTLETVNFTNIGAGVAPSVSQNPNGAYRIGCEQNRNSRTTRTFGSP